MSLSDWTAFCYFVHVSCVEKKTCTKFTIRSNYKRNETKQSETHKHTHTYYIRKHFFTRINLSLVSSKILAAFFMEEVAFNLKLIHNSYWLYCAFKEDDQQIL